MAEKSLLTLREIAEELGVNHKTIHHYKKVFEEFLAIQYQGRQVKYLPINVDLFAKILELKDEGVSNEVVYEKLKVWRSNDLKIYLSNYLSGDLTDHPSDSLSDYISDYRSDPLSDCPSDSRSDDLSNYPSSDLSVYPSDDTAGSDTKDVDGGPEEKTSPSDADRQYLEDRLAQIQSDLQAQLESMLDQQPEGASERLAAELKTGLENCLGQMSSAINSALTQFYKQIHELQQGLQGLEQRLGELENDLGTEPPQKLQLSELDLEQVQISAPAIELESEADAHQGAAVDPEQPEQAGSSFDLDFVRSSVQFGKPDKDAVVQWILAERKRDSSMSYGDLAERLNDAGIPTLRGREGWSRSVVRNLAVRGNGQG